MIKYDEHLFLDNDQLLNYKKSKKGFKRVSGIDYDSMAEGHNPKRHPISIKLMERIKYMDFFSDYLGWKTGGYRDNDEILMDMLDIYFKKLDC